MQEKIGAALTSVFNIGVIILAFTTPLLFWNQTSEFFETPKFLLLVSFIGILSLVWIIKCIVTGKITITKSSLDLPLFLLLASFIISSILAASKPLAIFGGLPKIHGGLASFIAYILFYLLLISNLKQISIIKQIIHFLLGSGVILSIVTLLSYAGINLLPFDFTKALNFTPTGSSFSTTAFLALLLPFSLIAILQGSDKDILGNMGSEVSSLMGIPNLKNNPFGKISLGSLLNKVILCLILTLFIATIALTGSVATYIAAAVSFGLALFISPQLSIKKNLVFIIIPLSVAGVITLASFIPSAGPVKNIFYSRAQNFPREIQLPLQTSWKVSVSTFRDFPVWGSGPASYANDFTLYKPAEFNNSKIWNIRFNSAFNEYLEFLATLGILGLGSLILFTIIFLTKALSALTSPVGSINSSLAITGITFFVLLALHPSTLALWVIGIILLASFMAVHKKATSEIQMGITTNSPSESKELNFNALSMVLLLISLGLIGTVYFMIGKFALADYHHRLALNSVAANKGLNAYNELVKSEQLNPYIDLYRSDLAQTNFALANAIATAKGPTEASPGGSLTDADKQNIQTLLTQAIAEGRNATALNPGNPANWEVLGSIYRQISGVAQNSLTFSLDAYGRAIQRDPMNPLLRLNVGGIYYGAKNYDQAIKFFSDVVTLKPDYANGYYNLAVALRDKGNLISAATNAERTVSLLDPKSSDYKVAADLLASLKEQIDTKKVADEQANKNSGINLGSDTTKPSALQGKNLPKVLNLPKPDKIASPPAVKKTQE